MEIIINGKPAALKEGTSFEYIVENRYFTGSDSFTLSITFPLRRCAQNLAIFGNIQRTDVDKRKVVFDCEIRDHNFCKSGSIAIVELNEVEVKTQFLEGRSEQNFNETFDNVYINDLDLGSWPTTLPRQITPLSAWAVGDAVALPWVNDASGNIQNEVVCTQDRYNQWGYQWAPETDALSWQPFLITITKRICQVMGYSFDFSSWEQSDYRYLLLCNTLPAAWDVPQYARALPHWTVAEFFEKLEYFLNCEFDIDHRAKFISFAFSKDVINFADPVELRMVVDEFSATISQDDDDCEYREAQNIVYADRDDEMWQYESCRWFVDDCIKNGKVQSYDLLTDLVEATRRYAKIYSYARNMDMNKLFYARDVDTYFLIRAYKNVPEYEEREVVENVQGDEYHYTYTYKVNAYHCCLQPINRFGAHIVNDTDDAKEISLDIVPAWIDELDEDKGNCLFLKFSSYDEPNSVGERVGGVIQTAEEGELIQPYLVQDLESGKKDEVVEYFSKIYVAFWDGAIEATGKYPHPYTDSVIVRHDGTIFRPHYSLRINRNNGMLRFNTHKINTRQKYTFSFLADKMPNVRAVFHINGKRYLCEKMTATFTESGRSRLVKGEFWKISE